MVSSAPCLICLWLYLFGNTPLPLFKSHTLFPGQTTFHGFCSTVIYYYLVSKSEKKWAEYLGDIIIELPPASFLLIPPRVKFLFSSKAYTKTFPSVCVCMAGGVLLAPTWPSQWEKGRPHDSQRLSFPGSRAAPGPLAAQCAPRCPTDGPPEFLSIPTCHSPQEPCYNKMPMVFWNVSWYFLLEYPIIIFLHSPTWINNASFPQEV